MSLLRRAFAAVALAAGYAWMIRLTGAVPREARLGGWIPLDLGRDD